MQLTVTQPFADYGVGAVITDPATIQNILNSELIGFVVVSGGGFVSNIVTGQITATGPTPAVLVLGGLNVSVWGSGVAATFALERSFDAGATWLPLTLVDQPLVLTNTFSTTFDEAEAGVLYRLNCLTFTGSAANFRLSHS